MDVGLLIRDPRISDLAITLISPHGTRVLLFENRGAASDQRPGHLRPEHQLPDGAVLHQQLRSGPGRPLRPRRRSSRAGACCSNYVDVLDDYTCLCLSNHILALFDGAVSNSLPTTNSLVPTNSIPYTLSFKVNHLPWLEGMVTWWPLDLDGRGHLRRLQRRCCWAMSRSRAAKSAGPSSATALATRMVVPRCAELDLGRGRGFTIEGWINPGKLQGRARLRPLTRLSSPAPSPTPPTAIGTASWHRRPGPTLKPRPSPSAAIWPPSTMPPKTPGSSAPSEAMAARPKPSSLGSRTTGMKANGSGPAVSP